MASRRATHAAAAAGLSLRLDREAALTLLAFDEYPIERSFFAGVAVVAPRVAVATRADGSLAFETSVAPIARDVDEDEAARTLRATLDAAVERALARGTRVAVALSGGLDSSVIAVAADAAMQRLGRASDRLLLYHMAPRAGPAEVEHARSIARSLDRVLLELPAPSGDPFEAVAPLAAAADFPFDGPGALVGLAAFRRLVVEGVDLVLTGDGGDEAVGAYGQLVTDTARPSPLVRLSQGLRTLVRPGYRRLAPTWLENRRLGRPAWLSKRLRDLRPPATSPAATSPAATSPPATSPDSRPGLSGVGAIRDRALRSSRQCAIVGWYRALERVTGVGTSFPFLDPAVEDLVVSLAPGHFASGGRQKGLLRRAFADVLPILEQQRSKDQADAEPLVVDDFRRYGDSWAERYFRSGALVRLDLLPTEDAAGVIDAAKAGSVRDLYRALSLLWLSIWADANAL